MLSIYDQLETRPLLVYLHDDESHFESEAQRAGLTVVSNFGSSQVSTFIDDSAGTRAADAAASPNRSCGILYPRARDGGRVLDDPRIKNVQTAVKEDDVVTIIASTLRCSLCPTPRSCDVVSPRGSAPKGR